MIGHEDDSAAADLFPVLRAADIEREPVSQSWLIEPLWSASAVGWVAGQPKSLKSWTALEMAVSVASGTPCLGRFAVKERGKALVYLAEDSLPSVRERLETLAAQRGLSIDKLDVDVITAPSMRLDLGRDQVRLHKTARALAPRLLVLDPLVRIHRADENSSAEVSSLLAYLRELQRELDLAIVVVHHVRKSAAPSQAAGQGLRGSGDLHAWSDSALYLRRRGENVVVTVEHRSAPTPPPISLHLASGDAPHLEIVENARHDASRSLAIEERVLAVLEESEPLTRAALRERLSVRNERLGRVLDGLLEEGAIERSDGGWRLTPTALDDRSRIPPTGMNGNGTIDPTAFGDLESNSREDIMPTEEELPL